MSERAYIICATPRTGSTLLCRMLKAAGSGDPDSFISRFIPEWAADWGVPEAETILLYSGCHYDVAVPGAQGHSAEDGCGRQGAPGGLGGRGGRGRRRLARVGGRARWRDARQALFAPGAG